MKPENQVKLLLDYEYLKKVQAELPSKSTVIFASLMQFIMGIITLTFLIRDVDQIPSTVLLFLLTVISVGLIIFSAYTFFGYLIRKRYILLIESLTQKNEK